jgi:hypothetical protein
MALPLQQHLQLQQPLELLAFGSFPARLTPRGWLGEALVGSLLGSFFAIAVNISVTFTADFAEVSINRRLFSSANVRPSSY